MPMPKPLLFSLGNYMVQFQSIHNRHRHNPERTKKDQSIIISIYVNRIQSQIITLDDVEPSQWHGAASPKLELVTITDNNTIAIKNIVD